MDSQALALQVGRQRWLLLPDRQALGSLELLAADGADSGRPAIWLGFVPRPSERRQLLSQRVGPVWLSGSPPGRPPLPPGWHATGASGFLARAGG